LGIIYRDAKNYNRALEYYNKSLALTTLPKYRNILINNIAFAYKEQKKYKKALLTFTKAYNNSVKIDDKKQTARALSNLGFVKSKLKYPDALTNLLEALDIRKTIQYIPGIVSSYLHLSEYYKDNHQRQKALFYANKVLAIGKQQQNINYQVDALSIIIATDNNSKIVEYKKLTDSIAIAKQINENKFAAIKYDFSKEKIKTEEAKLKLVESQLHEEKEKKSKIISQAIAGFILLLLFSSYFIFRIKHKKGKLEEIYKTETRISRKVHDEVANDIYHVMTQLQSNTDINEYVLDELESIYNKTRDISKENSAINMDAHFKELLSDLLISYKNNAVNVITKNISKVNWDKVSNEKKTAIYRTLQELMTNMKKHSNATFVVLVFNQKNNKISINFKDNGIGCNLKKNTGLQNVENRILIANGTITFDTEINKGFNAKITI
jgi:signal transduction histidine kinase